MKNLSLLLASTLLISCNQWSDDDSAKFLEQCEKTKWEKEFCDCAIEIVKKEYKSFAEISDIEKQMADILLDCMIKKNKD